MELQKKFIVGLALLSLFGTVTNFIYLSPLLTLLVPLAIYAFNKEQVQRPIAWLFAFLSFFLLSVILYDVQSLIEFGFYRRDGNFIISYAPLFILPLFSFTFKIKKYFRRFYLFVVILYSLLFTYHLLTANLLGNIHEIVFGGLFYAQNAVGGFLSIAASLGFAYYYHRRSKRELFYFLVIFVIMAATYSRGSILGLVLGIIAWYCSKTDRIKTLAILILLPILFTVGSLMVGYPFYDAQISTQSNVEIDLDEDVGQKNANVMIRLFYTFPRAYYVFKQSPIFGTGVGSYDDQPFNFEEIVPYVKYNSQPNKLHTDAHSHHSYLQFLAEQGIAGLALFLTFWISLFLYLKRIKTHPILRDYLLIAFFTITFASFTEHRITAPAMMLPFTISVGMFMMHTQKYQHVIIEEK